MAGSLSQPYSWITYELREPSDSSKMSREMVAESHIEAKEGVEELKTK